MHSGGASQQGHGSALGHVRSTGSAISPSSSSSAVSTPRLGFDTMQQSLQHQQLLRKPEGNEALLGAYHVGSFPGAIGGNNFVSSGSFQTTQQPIKFIGSPQHHGPTSVRADVSNMSQDMDHQVFNPAHQSYIQYAFQQKANLGMQQQSQINANINVSRPMQAQQSQNMPNIQLAMQAWARERNIDLSSPTNANLVAQLIPLLQSRIGTQQNSNDNTSGNEQFSTSDMSGQFSQRPHAFGNGMMHPPNSSANTSHAMDQSLLGKNALTSGEAIEMQNLKQSNKPSPQAASMDGSSGNQVSLQAPLANQKPPQHCSNFTKQQLHVLKAQILAFRRLKKGDGPLPQELLQAIDPPSLELQPRQMYLPYGTSNQDRSFEKNQEGPMNQLDNGEKDPQASSLINVHKEVHTKEHVFTGDDRALKEPVSVVSSEKGQQSTQFVVKPEFKSEHETESGNLKTSVRSDLNRGKAIASPTSVSDDTALIKKSTQSSSEAQSKDRKYHGPLFDFPYFTRKSDSFGLGTTATNGNNNLTLAYTVKDLLFEEAADVLHKKRMENMNKIVGLLSLNLERKIIQPDLVLRLQIEEKKLRLSNVQERLRDEIDLHQKEIMTMPDRPYRKFVRLCERQRLEFLRKVQATQRAEREKQLKLIFQWRKKVLESHWAIRDARTARNRGVAKYHERTLREFSKRKDNDHSKRMEALKNNDVQRYREMLEQQSSVPGGGGERYVVLSSFLTQTEDYLHKLGSKITDAKNQQEVQEAANAAAAAARAEGLSEEEVRAAAACAGEEVMIRNRFSEMNAPKEGSSVNKYYTLAHAVSEKVVRQPSMLRVGTLRDYQLVGLQWMLSLYNNKLNGILADEMGLGKTVQVMALIAYLMEFKGNYGPHLIIVPNAVLVNWKSELHSWLPSVSCIYYVGTKDQRSKLFSQEVCAMKFNVLVTTYEFIMYDRSKLAKVDWKYIVIDEAQRMKDRESVLARDLDRYRCQRRLLLTGTPLQNDLKELWSLLNLLLPEVFDNRKAFHDWFAQPFQKEGPSHNGEDDWLETEKKVIIIHRLHQILEPFMLRRRVEDVEGSLPPKVSIVLKCRMSAMQSSIYDWIKSTGTLRIDPEDEILRTQKNPNYQIKVYKPLNNRCMELRKACNHPLLNYPYYGDLSKEFIVRSCGKLWILDRILVKLHRTGHRVLLFSTMTKLLDIMEEYLQWRRLVYRRIDGTTSLEDRESAIMDFNAPDSDCFIFLLSIRAAGRGLNLQSADTVVIYDPDPNPKNEEQAVARAHRIGQTREVKVIYMEAVVDKVSSHQKEDEFMSGGNVDMEDDDLAGKDRYVGSIESLIRNNIQQYKIDMADEVINAGRFDQRTTHEERRLTLESLLHDDERYQETVHDVPSLHEVNRMISRSEEEVEFFDQMDEELDWIDDMTRYNQIPVWLRASSREVNGTIANMSKKPSKYGLFGVNIGVRSHENCSDLLAKPELKRGRPKGKNVPSYAEMEDGSVQFSDTSSEERNERSVHEDDGDIGEFDDEETSGNVGEGQTNKDQLEDDCPVRDGPYEYSRASKDMKKNCILEDDGSSGSVVGSQKMLQILSPVSSQKFGSLSALDAMAGSFTKMHDELEEGEIAMSADSYMDHQQPGSWIHDRGDEGEYEQVSQAKIKRKRSIRARPRHSIETAEGKSSNEKPSFRRGDTCHLISQSDRRYELKSPMKHNQSESSSRSKRTLPLRENANSLKSQKSSGKLNCKPVTAEDGAENSRESWEDKATASGASNFGMRMSEFVQRKCKNVTSKFRRRIEKEGPQIVPMLTDLWKQGENLGYMGDFRNTILDIRKIDQRVDRFEYNGIMEFVSDVQCMLKSAVQVYGSTYEVRTEAKKVHDLFFDIMKIVFPDSDFRESRNTLSFSGSFSTSSSRHAGLKRQHNPIKPNTSVELARLVARGPRDQAQREDSPLLTHPGELVICKKRRKEREKAGVRSGTSGLGVLNSPAQRETRSSSQHRGWVHQPGQRRNDEGNTGWANPVKRTRTDAGKRRPSHL